VTRVLVQLCMAVSHCHKHKARRGA
jgi:hypothetical protein